MFIAYIVCMGCLSSHPTCTCVYVVCNTRVFTCMYQHSFIYQSTEAVNSPQAYIVIVDMFSGGARMYMCTYCVCVYMYTCIPIIQVSKVNNIHSCTNV